MTAYEWAGLIALGGIVLIILAAVAMAAVVGLGLGHVLTGWLS